MSLHPKAVHWQPSMPNEFGPVTGSESEIGCTWKGADGMWHAQCNPGPESFGPFKTEKMAKAAVEEFVHNGYER